MSAFKDKTVFVTGHTGFKGSWLCSWLLRHGANVVGYSLPEMPTTPSLFEQLELQKELRHQTGDIRDFQKLSRAILDAKPDFVFHMAAQPLVLLSYEMPRETFEVNVQGTVNVLESLRTLRRQCIAIVVTSDKCYENREWVYPYRENEAMGGYDPYSASKGCAELVTAAYRRSFFERDDSVLIASARAGNVIGGGDWATDRIVPDCIKAIATGESISVRNSHATRPWQHVLEPLGGYLKLAESIQQARQANDSVRLKVLCSSFNFGPQLDANRTVADLVAQLTASLGGTWRDVSDPQARHEATRLSLAIDKACHCLNWHPRWNFHQTVKKVAEWHQRTTTGESVAEVMADQIAEFTNGCDTIEAPVKPV